MIVRIDIEAGTARALWDDGLALDALGTLDVWRASHVEFNVATQGWEVTTPDGKFLRGGFPKRADALAWEREWAEGRLDISHLAK